MRSRISSSTVRLYAAACVSCVALTLRVQYPPVPTLCLVSYRVQAYRNPPSRSPSSSSSSQLGTDTYFPSLEMAQQRRLHRHHCNNPSQFYSSRRFARFDQCCLLHFRRVIGDCLFGWHLPVSLLQASGASCGWPVLRQVRPHHLLWGLIFGSCDQYWASLEPVVIPSIGALSRSVGPRINLFHAFLILLFSIFAVYSSPCNVPCFLMKLTSAVKGGLAWERRGDGICGVWRLDQSAYCALLPSTPLTWGMRVGRFWTRWHHFVLVLRSYVLLAIRRDDFFWFGFETASLDSAHYIGPLVITLINYSPPCPLAPLVCSTQWFNSFQFCPIESVSFFSCYHLLCR